MKTILRRADLTYNPSTKTVVFAQPWFKIEGLLAILNQDQGQVIYRTTDGWGGWNSGTQTLTLKSSVNTSGHNAGDSLQAIYEQPGIETPILVHEAIGALTDAAVTTPSNAPAFLYGFKLTHITALSTATLNLQIKSANAIVLRSTMLSATPETTSMTFDHPVYCPDGLQVTQTTGNGQARSYIYYRLA